MPNRPARVSLSICAALAFAGAQLASAANAPAPKFESLDKDSDGKVSLNEATEHDGLFVAFKSLDKNRDGVLTKEEFAGYQQQRSNS